MEMEKRKKSNTFRQRGRLAELALELGAAFQQREYVSVNIRLFGGYFKFYLAQARLKRAGLQAAQALVGDLARIVDVGRLKEQGGDQGLFLRGFQQRRRDDRGRARRRVRIR